MSDLTARAKHYVLPETTEGHGYPLPTQFCLFSRNLQSPPTFPDKISGSSLNFASFSLASYIERKLSIASRDSNLFGVYSKIGVYHRIMARLSITALPFPVYSTLQFDNLLDLVVDRDI